MSATAAWGKQEYNARGTIFRVGAAYGLVLAGVAVGLGDQIMRVEAYPPTNHGKREGWMRRRRHEDVADTSRAIWRTVVKGATVTTEPSDDELMALGVAVFHLDELRMARIRARGVTVKTNR